MAREIRGKIQSYTYSFHRYAKWLYLNGIEYELREPMGEHDEYQYADALIIVVYKANDKIRRRLTDTFFQQVFPQIRNSVQFWKEQGI